MSTATHVGLFSIQRVGETFVFEHLDGRRSVDPCGWIGVFGRRAATRPALKE